MDSQSISLPFAFVGKPLTVIYGIPQNQILTQYISESRLKADLI